MLKKGKTIKQNEKQMEMFNYQKFLNYEEQNQKRKTFI